jgi:hypothetical protein
MTLGHAFRTNKWMAPLKKNGRSILGVAGSRNGAPLHEEVKSEVPSRMLLGSDQNGGLSTPVEPEAPIPSERRFQ